MTIIEVSKKYDNDNTENYKITNILKEPIKIKNGQSLIMKMAILDSKTATQFQNMEITNDINITVECGFWVANLPQDIGDYDTLNQNTKFFEYNICRDTGFQLIKSSRNFTLPKGNYAPSEISSYITRKLNELDYKNSLNVSYITDDVINNPQNYFLRGQNQYYIIRGIASLTNDKVILINKTDNGDINNPKFSVGNQVTVQFNGTDYLETSITAITTYAQDTTKLEIEFNDAFPSGNTIIDVFLMKQYQTLFNAGDLQDATIYNTYSKDTYFGANQISLVFNYENNNKFTFENMHSPLYDPKSGNPAVLTYFGHLGAPFSRICAAWSGVFFTKLEPVDFWQNTLGFNLDSILCTYDPVNYKLNQELQPGVNITTQFIDYNSISVGVVIPKIPVGDPSQKGKNLAQYQDSNITNPIIGELGLNQGNNRFYYIWADMGLNFNNHYKDGRKWELVGIAGKNYDSNGGLYVFAESSFQYTHLGEDITISSLTIQILNEDETPANVGINNTLFFEID